MLLPDITRTYEPVRLAQAARLDQKRDALRDLFPKNCNALLQRREFTNIADAALIDHLFYLALNFASAETSDALDRLDKALEEWSVDLTSQRQLMCISRAQCVHVADSAFLSPIYLYDFSGKDPRQAAPWLESARSYLETTGFSMLVDLSMGLLVELDRKSEGEHLESYTITALHASIFMDSHRLAIRNAETLVHESAHNWLNYLFDHFEEPLLKTPRWFSPWRGVERPVAGMVHGIAAFSYVVLFLRAAAERLDLPAAEAEYAVLQARAQSARLSTLAGSLDDILSHIRTPMIAEVIESLFRAALQSEATAKQVIN
jgi:hypothetical protein